MLLLRYHFDGEIPENFSLDEMLEQAREDAGLDEELDFAVDETTILEKWLDERSGPYFSERKNRMPAVNKQQAVSPKKAAKAAGVIERIVPVAFDEDDGIKILLYGRSGSGKTTLWSTFPGPILALICSGGNKPGELRSLGKEERKKTRTLTVESSRDILEIVTHQQESGEFKTLVLDHVSGLQDKILAEILGVDEIPAQKSWGLASQQQYGQLSLQMKDILRALLELSCNVVIIGQERESNADATSDLLSPTVGVALTPSLAGWLNPACDYVCQTFIAPKMVDKRTKIGNKVVVTQQRGEGVQYCLRTAPHDVYSTKFRVPKGAVLPNVLVDPSYDKIMALIRGENEI